jgi:heme-binding NEAT domain protein
VPDFSQHVLTTIQNGGTQPPVQSQQTSPSVSVVEVRADGVEELSMVEERKSPEAVNVRRSTRLVDNKRKAQVEVEPSKKKQKTTYGKSKGRKRKRKKGSGADSSKILSTIYKGFTGFAPPTQNTFNPFPVSP